MKAKSMSHAVLCYSYKHWNQNDQYSFPVIKFWRVEFTPQGNYSSKICEFKLQADNDTGRMHWYGLDITSGEASNRDDLTDLIQILGAWKKHFSNWHDLFTYKKDSGYHQRCSSMTRKIVTFLRKFDRVDDRVTSTYSKMVPWVYRQKHAEYWALKQLNLTDYCWQSLDPA